MTADPHSTDRRALLQTAAAALAGNALNSRAADAAVEPPVSPALAAARVAQPTPGKPGDFDFLSGHWRILNHKRKGDAWDVFEGEASCWGILGGVCSVEELRIPARKFAGLGLRLLDLKTQQWRDFWVNAASGALTPPGLPGSFEGGAGIFESSEEEDGKPVIYRSVWDRITLQSCRWQQGASRDGGKTWVIDWSMDWTRRG
jgi:hypothetical protein